MAPKIDFFLRNKYSVLPIVDKKNLFGIVVNKKIEILSIAGKSDSKYCQLITKLFRILPNARKNVYVYMKE